MPVEAPLLTPERKTIEIPKLVDVDGHPGALWQGPLDAARLTHRLQSNRSYEMLDLDPSFDRIMLRMTNGDIIMLGTRHPENEDNDAKGYFLTSTAMNQGRASGEGVRALNLDYDFIEGLTLETDHRVVLPGNHASEGKIVEKVSYNTKKTIQDAVKSRWTPNGIYGDFLKAIGQ